MGWKEIRSLVPKDGARSPTLGIQPWEYCPHFSFLCLGFHSWGWDQHRDGGHRGERRENGVQRRSPQSREDWERSFTTSVVVGRVGDVPHPKA